jgi:hypothetical protein
MESNEKISNFVSQRPFLMDGKVISILNIHQYYHVSSATTTD